MQWHDMIVLKTLFLKELVSKSAILNEVFWFWNQTILKSNFFFRETFFSTLSRAQLGKPDWSRILTESQKSSQQNSAVFHTRQYSGTHYAQVLNFLSGNCLNLKVNRNMFLYLINCHFDTVFISKFYVFWEFPDKFHWNRLQCTARQTRSSENREQNLNHSKSSKKFKANIFHNQRMVNAEVFKIITKFVIFI